MATIKNTVTLQDKMSKTLSNIERQALSNLKTYKQLEKEQQSVKQTLDDLSRSGQIESDMANQLRMTYDSLGESLYDLRNNFTEVTDQEEELVNTTDQTGFSMAEVNQTLEVAQKGWQLLSQAIQEANVWLGEYNKQFNAEFTAGTSMSAMMGMSKDEIREIYDYAGELQSKGIIGDEALVSGAGIMASAATSKDSLKQLMEAAANATVANEGLNASQASFESTANQMRRALDGSASMLERNNILTKAQVKEIDNIDDRMEKEAKLIEYVNANTQNANELLASTAQGGMIQANNQLNDMQENLGQGVLPYFVAFKQLLAEILQPISDFAAANSDVLVPTFIAVLGGLGALIAGLTIYKVVSTLAAAGTLVMAAPFLIIIALIAAFVLAINLAANALSEWSGTSVSALGLVFGALNVVITGIQNLFIDLQNILQGIIDGIVLLFIGLSQIVIGVINSIATAIDHVFGSNLASATQGLLDKLDEQGQAILNDPGFKERKSYSEGFDKGYDFGEGISDKLFAGTSGASAATEDLFKDLNKNISDVTVPGGGGGKAIKTTTDDDLLSDEDVQMLLDIATRDYQLNYQQMTPNISVSFGDIRETVDVDNVLDVVGSRVEDLLNGDVEVKN